MREIKNIKLYQKYFKSLIELEREEEMATQLMEIRTLSGKERQRRGRAILDVRGKDAGTGLGGTYLVRLGGRGKLPDTQISVGDLVILSSGNPSGKEEHAVVTELTKGTITVAYQTMPPHYVYGKGVRVDLYANDVTFKRMSEAVGKLKPHQVLSDLLLFHRDPEVDSNSVVDPEFINQNLNEKQKFAVKKSLESKNIFLLHGPPGTGKTTTLTEIMIQHVKNGNKVLATADSNTAVDNMVEKLIKYGVKVLRIGNPARIHPELIPVCLDYQIQNTEGFQSATAIWNTIHELKQDQEKFTVPNGQNRRGLSDQEILKFSRNKTTSRGIPIQKIHRMANWLKIQQNVNKLVDDAKKLEEEAVSDLINSAQIVLSTNSAAGGEVLEPYKFDVTVIDECTQSVEPSSLISMTKSKKWIMAGDHKQLPPTVICEEAEALLLSLFERWINGYKTSSVMLEVQYRMNSEIMKFSNRAFYGGQLEAAESAKDKLLKDLNGFNSPDKFYDPQNYSLIRPDLPVSLINVAGKEAKKEGAYSYYNEEEASEVKKVIDALLFSRVFPEDIGVISPYEGQVSLLKKIIDVQGLEIKSIDGFQGREKEIIVLSLVRSNNKGRIGFLTDYRRLNVALTRAKKKLFIIGNVETLNMNKYYSALIRQIEGSDLSVNIDD
ncbi:IGHMBP2 family helicase [Marinigracilibium pacificum]|uniref:DNA helicase n=1 Tax=Marinigracilibium pacificum TaxID=2729599 RepID=A0A848J2J6_9BACT|nr:IGHMBP2 family helicase [Marinigracilibium pacificum]NMM49996.1 IGHMBP2 family helicase [Marinigracilibium pacificum]